MTRLVTSCPKPRRRARSLNRWNGLPRPSKPIARTSVKKQGMLGRGTLRKVNPVAEAKRRARYRKGLAAYKRSVCFRYVEERAKGRCEFEFFWERTKVWLRCGQRRDLPDEPMQHHHLTYARFGGREQPEDIRLVCTRHHAELESQHPTRRRNYGRADQERAK